MADNNASSKDITFSRPHLLIAMEYENLKEDQPWGIEAQPITKDNIFEWVAIMKGLPNTIWEGGKFILYLKFDEHFNVTPPKVCFHTIPFHPNINIVTGRPSIDFLDDLTCWNESYTVRKILMTIQNLLANPSLDQPVNQKAAEMITKSPHTYREMVLDSVLASQRAERGGNSPTYIEKTQGSEQESRVHFKIKDDQKLTRKTVSSRTPKKVTKLLFEDYHVTWSGIATSQAHLHMKNPLLETLKNNPVLQKIHLGLPHKEIEEQMTRQLEEYGSIMYGRFRGKTAAEHEKAINLARLNKMKRIYLPRSLIPNSAHTHETIPPPSTEKGKEDEFEKEVNDLVGWTKRLDANTLET